MNSTCVGYFFVKFNEEAVLMEQAEENDEDDRFVI